MAAIPPSSAWIPEDDLLLKNAVEAGASLEALAKGALQFSRRFTLEELRYRWHSLLYDPDISAQAAARMFELEQSASNLSSKLNKSDNSKEKKYVPEKRKARSICRQYYAMRKRIRRDFLASADIGLLSESNLHDGGNVGDFQKHGKLGNDPPTGNFMLGDCTSNHFGLQETDFDISHAAFPQTMRDIPAPNIIGNTGDAFRSGNPYSLEDNRIVRINSLLGLPRSVSSLSIKEAAASDEREFFQHHDSPEDVMHTSENNLVDVGKCSGVEKTGPSQGLSDRKLLEAEYLGTKSLCTFNSINSTLQNVCSEFGERQQFNSPDSDDNVSLHTMGFSSPLPRTPLWETMEDISTPAMLVDMNLADKSRCVQHKLTLPDNSDSENKRAPAYDDLHSGHLLGDTHNGNICVSLAAISDGENVDISDSLLNFSLEDELVFVGADGKDVMYKSCDDHNLNSLMLNSPSDITEKNVLNVEREVFTVSSTCLATPGAACPSELKILSSPVHSDRGYQPTACPSEGNLSSTSVLCSKSPEHNDGTMYCTLNTEDPDIPCNDDIFLLIHPSASFTASATTPITADAIDLTSSLGRGRKLLNLSKIGDDPAPSFPSLKMVVPNMLPKPGPRHVVAGCEFKSNLTKKGDDPAPSFPSLKMVVPNMLPKTSPCHVVPGCEFKSNLTKKGDDPAPSFPSLKMAVPKMLPKKGPRHVVAGCEFKSNLTKIGDDPAPSFPSLKMAVPKMLPKKGPRHVVAGCDFKSKLSANHLVMDPRKTHIALESSQCKTEQATPHSAIGGTLGKDVLKVELEMVDAPAALRETPLHAEEGSIKMTHPESGANPSISDGEEYESDNDVPYFSDIEAMILEMDLGPYDQDSDVSRKVAMYQHEESRRKIIRLEQCAHASLHRAMASQGALAILYGRQLKHYIKKTEVLLGRSTDEIKVDIDLGKEGRANKISRRQGIIKMGGDGSFFLKNLGKSSISVNGKEVPTGMSVTLSTSCLIEIRGMSFVFETNGKYVRRYLDNMVKKSKEKRTSFEWSAEG